MEDAVTVGSKGEASWVRGERRGDALTARKAVMATKTEDVATISGCWQVARR